MNAIAQPLAAQIDSLPVPLVFTDSAADKVKQLVEEEGNPELKLRVFVQGGGCSGCCSRGYCLGSKCSSV